MDVIEDDGIHLEEQDVEQVLEDVGVGKRETAKGDGDSEPQRDRGEKVSDLGPVRVSEIDTDEHDEHKRDSSGEILRAIEDGEDDNDEVVDVSPSGQTLSSLAYSTQEDVSRFKNLYVYDNTFPVLPASISDFKHLRKLKFFSNEIKVLPEEVGDLTQLEHLYVKTSPTGLGSLPPLGKLSALRALELHQAPSPPSASTLSRDIAQLHSLTRLSVCHFSISWVPAEIGSLTNLEELDLSFNKLKALPKEIAGLKALKSLRVAGNKLVELPSQLTGLANLSSIDVAHNRLTSLQSLGLQSMTSLRALNAQFNKLQSAGQIPEWVCCQLEGNELLEAAENGREVENVACTEEYLLDWELLPSVIDSTVKEGDCHTSELAVPSSKGSPPSLKGSIHLKSRRGWRKQDNQQHKARQDRLNSSRKHRPDDHAGEGHLVEGSPVEQDNGRESKEGRSISFLSFQHKAVPQSVDSSGDGNKMEDCATDGEKRDGSEKRKHTNVKGSLSPLEENSDLGKEFQQDDDYDKPADASCNNYKASVGATPELKHPLMRKEGAYHCDSDRRYVFKENSCRKAICGDRSCQSEEGLPLGDSQDVVEKGEMGVSAIEGLQKKEEVGLRRHGSDTDKNPKPSKRRRSVEEFSAVSYKYCNESFCGFSDRLPDGFYDAGRDRPFCALDVLEKEQPSFDSREVILVDRERDEDLDVIALSAQQLLQGLGPIGPPAGGDPQRSPGAADVFRRAAVLALFVSDCFGGSDKTQNITNMRRAALGGTAGAPFVCSCSSNGSSIVANGFGDNSVMAGAVLPSVHLLCEGAVRFLKAQRGSNVLPIGSLPYGVCRHRAILLKYLCDRADPIIPCELVRGYLDYMPHAWNVILVENGSGTVRMLVDGCRPLDIRHESDPEYFCRYIPLRRFHMPLAVNGGQMTLGSDISSPVLHEEIGHGASGAVVRRCTFGTFTAAAKVRQLEGGVEGSAGKGLESSCLSELRILCSLRQHPCIVTFYGHQFSTVPDRGSQLMIFMEHIQGGSLKGLLQELGEKGQTSMAPKLACQVARNVACALALLHSKGIVHRDIKSSNVLVDIDTEQSSDGGPIVKLCDFDSAVPLRSSAAHTCYLAHRGVPPADVCVGTPRWIAPEVLRAMYGRHPYGLEADLWSFGCLLAELLTLKVPYAGLLESEVHSCIQMGQRPQLPAELDKLVSQPYNKNESATGTAGDTENLRLLVRLFYSCTEASPLQRPTAKEAFTILSGVFGPAPKADVNPVFGEVVLDDTLPVLVAGPKLVLSLTDEAVEDPATLSEPNVLCSCEVKTCSSCEGSSAPYTSKLDTTDSVSAK